MSPGPDHKYQGGPYGVCRRCGGDPHGLRDEDEHMQALDAACAEPPGYEDDDQALRREGLKEAWRVAHDIATRHVGRPGADAAREIAWALRDLAWPERRT